MPANLAEVAVLFCVLIERAIGSGFVDRALDDEPQLDFSGDSIVESLLEGIACFLEVGCEHKKEDFEVGGGLVVYEILERITTKLDFEVEVIVDVCGYENDDSLA